ncbi:hypothetical protein ACP70R_007530 [Stipagrostis hirtigluma subsp. patula]
MENFARLYIIAGREQFAFDPAHSSTESACRRFFEEAGSPTNLGFAAMFIPRTLERGNNSKAPSHHQLLPFNLLLPVHVSARNGGNTNKGNKHDLDKRLLKAAISGDSVPMKHLALHDPCVLLGITPEGNTCLHISSIHGHERFSEDVLKLRPSLLAVDNNKKETPLITAVMSGHVSLARALLRRCRDQQMIGVISKQDIFGWNALHHAIRSGLKELALEMIVLGIAAAPELSHAVNKNNELPMFAAVMRGFADVSDALLKIPSSAHAGPGGMNVLHAAVKNNDSVMVKRILETRAWLAREGEGYLADPVCTAVLGNHVDVLRVILEHDSSLGHEGSETNPLLNVAASQGHVDVARELLRHCPDAPYCLIYGSTRTCLHEAVSREDMEFVEFILQAPQLRKVVNMQDEDGHTALHCAVQKCNPKIVAALLRHPDIDVTVLDRRGNSATWMLSSAADYAKTLNWNEVSILMLKADPTNKAYNYNLQKAIKDAITQRSRKDVKKLTETYTNTTSLVAILIATITFAAAFTLPGGYSSDAGSQGLPIMARKFAFQAFLISDTAAMFSSLSVAFICIIARWEDLEFLLYYRSFTKKLMWFAYMATTIAFGTGLYTVLAPRLLWLAIAICVMSVLLPILTKLVGEWPVLKLRYQLGRTLKSEFLDMV